MLHAQPNSGMNEVINSTFISSELSFFSTLYWIKLLYRAAQECLLFTGTNIYLIVFGDIPCSASPGIFLSKWFFLSSSDTLYDLKLLSLFFSWALKPLIYKKSVITSGIEEISKRLKIEHIFCIQITLVVSWLLHLHL